MFDITCAICKKRIKNPVGMQKYCQPPRKCWKKADLLKRKLKNPKPTWRGNV